MGKLNLAQGFFRLTVVISILLGGSIAGFGYLVKEEFIIQAFVFLFVFVWIIYFIIRFIVSGFTKN